MLHEDIKQSLNQDGFDRDRRGRYLVHKQRNGLDRQTLQNIIYSVRNAGQSIPLQLDNITRDI